MNNQIVFEDENIQVFYSKGLSDYILITFSDLVLLANDKNFYAEKAVKKNNIETIGFVAKKGNWYPSESIKKSKLLIEHLLLNRTVVIYGGSMGGYASIKYSKELFASCVISFCPQWSIDKGECEGWDPGYSYYFKNSMINMSIKKEDVQGRIFIFYDKSHDMDRRHALQIRKISPSINEIIVPGVGHHVTSTYAGSDVLKNLIDYCLFNEILKIKLLNKKVYRKSMHWADSIIKRKENLLLESIYKKKDVPSENFKKLAPKLAWKIHKEEGIESFIDFMMKNKSLFRTFIDYYWTLKFICSEKNKTISIKTYHGKYLIFDLCEMKLKQSNLPLKETERIVSFDIQKNKISLYFKLKDEKINIDLSDYSNFGFNQEKESFRLFFGHTENYCIYINDGNLFFCAERNGSLSLNRKIRSDWETFSIEVI